MTCFRSAGHKLCRCIEITSSTKQRQASANNLHSRAVGSPWERVRKTAVHGWHWKVCWFEFVSARVKTDPCSVRSNYVLPRHEVSVSRRCCGTSRSRTATSRLHPWFLPRCMKCRRGLAMRILSVRLSVRPSVCQTRDLWQNGRKIGPDFYTIRKNI